MKIRVIVLLALSVILALSLFTVGAMGNEQPDKNLLTSELLNSGSGNYLAFHPETGLVTFFSAGSEPVVLTGQLYAENKHLPQEVGSAFLAKYGPLFGAHSPAEDLALEGMNSTGNEAARSVLRYRQMYHGVPVLGGELRVAVTGHGVHTVNGELAPLDGSGLSAVPQITVEEAVSSALAGVARKYELSETDLVSDEAELWVYSPVLLGQGPDWNRLVWRLEVRSDTRPDLRELVLVDAHAGKIALSLNQIATALDRVIYDNENNRFAGLPGIGPVREEGEAATGNTDVDALYEYIGDTYDFYQTYHGRDGYDDAGSAFTGTVRYCDTSITSSCPYDNAFWDGTQLVFGEGMVTDDVVAHEITHAVTQYSSGLFYMHQSGAINEGLSDIWGEFVDLTNGAGDDSAAARWLLGEDLPIGAIRSMKNPAAYPYGDPDRMTSIYYNCDLNFQDNGGVHSNSGVLNKAAYLITDGGNFNGYIISGLGIEKTARIFYEMQTNLLVSGSDYLDVYYLLPQACRNLTGTNGIVAADCAEVEKAVKATEMNLSPTACAAPEVAPCPEGQSCTDLFYDDLENPSSGNWETEGVWYYPQNTHSYTDFDATYATSGVYNFWGDDPEYRQESAIEMGKSVTLPPGQAAYLQFRHAYEFERGLISYYDGGVVEYSLDGTEVWQDIGALPAINGYDGVIDASSVSNNPLQGRDAFVGSSHGYMSSRFDLTSLAGHNVKFRFRIGTDTGGAHYGWFIDDIRINTVGAALPSPTVTSTATKTATATATTTVTITATKTVFPTATASPTATPKPTATPTWNRNSLPMVMQGWDRSLTPNDPQFSKQWNMEHINAPQAWAVTTGTGAPIVAVLDTGISLSHPDLQANVVAGWDFVNEDAYANDDNGHGTHVAGIIAAVGNNGIGVAGTTWRGRLMPVKVLDGNGVGDAYTAWEGVRWAVDQGARVINMSLGSFYPSLLLEDAVNYAVSRGVVVVAASGNVGGSTGVSKGTPAYPAAYPGAIGVGATDSSNLVTTFSNEGFFVDVVAPGDGIISTYIGASYAYFSGTSMATPHVSGLASLLLAFKPSLTGEQVGAIIMATAKDLGAEGRDNAYGYGLIDAAKAVTAGVQGAAVSASAATGNSDLSFEAIPGTYWPGTVLVQMREGASVESIRHLLSSAAIEAQAVHPDLPGLLRLQVPEGQEESIRQELLSLPEVETAYLDAVIFAM